MIGDKGGKQMVRAKCTSTGELNVVLTLYVFEDADPSIMLNYKTISLKKKKRKEIHFLLPHLNSSGREMQA